MGRKKIREYDAKRIIKAYFSTYDSEIALNLNSVLVYPEDNLKELAQNYPWLKQNKLVVKPDQLFGKRKKLGLMLFNASWEEAVKFLEENRNKEISIGQVSGKLTHFLIEPYVEHEQEYYLCLESGRETVNIRFSATGGADIDENWGEVKLIKENEIQQLELPLVGKKFIVSLIKMFHDLDFTYLEINPFTIKEDKIDLLDAVAEVDSCAEFKNGERWGKLEFPPPFGKKIYPEEEFIQSLDKNSGASLKLTLLNPKGRIWNILSGGGASLIYLDALVNAGQKEEIANYGEYSGNPTTEETYHYTKTILSLMTTGHHPQGKVLIIGGAIANFTDVEKTFVGIIRALNEFKEQLINGKISLYVRRGGPNYQNGLKLIEQAGKEIGIPIFVHGPETPMTQIVEKAAERLR
ncbi:MAG TPA: ATP citrate lyase citrate-binding domain-containing protein [Candidatus Nanoarchaeia archaeon]|nr:ATP citrate lyase citrate-binding domain-containing protein [Candidatus Nanoarchaeia archaeon]